MYYVGPIHTTHMGGMDGDSLRKLMTEKILSLDVSHKKRKLMKEISFTYRNHY
jgi:hypothetical protein